MVWLAAAAALALLAAGDYAAVTASTSGPDAPVASGVASGVAVPTWAAELPMSTERARPTSAPTPTTPTPTPEPVQALAAAAPEPEPSSRATPRPGRALVVTEQSAPEPSVVGDPVPARPDEQPPTAQQNLAPAPVVEQEPDTAAPLSPTAGSSQRARSQRPPLSASTTPSVLSSQRGQSGN